MKNVGYCQFSGMTEEQYRAMLIEEITTKRTAWCKRNDHNRETLAKKCTRLLEIYYDTAK